MSVITLLLLFLNLLLNFPLLQTWLTHRIASYYSAKLHAKVEIGKVDFEFLKKLVLKDVFIQDQHSDTLLYAKALKLDIGALSFDKHDLYVSDIILDKARFNAVMYKNDSDINLQFLIDYFASKDTTTSHGPKWNIKFGALTLNDIYFSYRDEHNSYQTTAMNFSDLQIHDINGKISDIEFLGDTLRASIEKLSARERCGFILKNFTCYVKLSSKEMVLNALKIETPNTKLSTDLVFKYNAFRDFYDFVNKVDMYAVFRKSTLCFDDLGKFTTALSGVHNCFTLSGEYSGTVSHLKGRDMKIAWGKISSFQGNVSLNGLPDIQKTYIDVDIDRLVTSKAEVELLPRPPFDEQGHIELPANMTCLKTVEFNGSFKGYVTDFTANGTLSTGIGKVSAALSMRQDTLHNNLAYYKGSIQTQAFDLGKFWGNKDLGTTTSSINIEGQGLTRSNADAEITGSINGFTFRKYNYTNLALSGELRKGFFSGLLESDDPNLQMDFNGDIDISSKIHTYHFNTYITKANLEKLHIVNDSIGPVTLSTHAEVELTGNSVDNMDGSIQIDSTKYAYHKDRYHLDYLKINSTHSKNNFHNITINSDYLDGTISGKFPLVHLPQCIQNMMSFYLPSVFSKEVPVAGDKEDDSYDFDITFNKNTGLTNLFVPTLKIAQGTKVKAHYMEQKNIFTLSAESPSIEWAGRKMKHIDITISGNTSAMNIKAACDSLYMSDSLYAAAFIVNGEVSKDTTHYSIKWNNDSANYADIPGYIAFPNKTDIYFKLVDPIISLHDSIWQANNQNSVLMDTSGIMAKNLEFYHTQQSVMLRGKLSRQKNDAMVLIFKKLNLENFNLGAATQLNGTIDGTVSVANVYEQHPFFTGALTFNNLRLNKQLLGDGNVNCYWDNSMNAIALNGQLTSKDTKYISFIGDYYDRDTNNLAIDVTLSKFPVKLFAPYLKDYTSDFEGSLNGNARISGNLNKPVFYGNITANIKRFKFDYLNTYYHSSAINIAISPDTFRIMPSAVLDEKRDSAIASGIVTHNHFKDFKMDLNINAEDFMCLNTTESNNSLYYGTGFASGNVKIYGPLNSLNLDANITTDKGTQFNIPLSNASEVDQTDVIRFVNKKDTARKKFQVFKPTAGGLQMHFTVHLTPDATTKLIFAEKVGDIMQGTGTGTLQMDVSPQGDLTMKGQYTVLDGTYLFTAKNIISKKFAIQSGGTIIWNGDPYNADIKLDAVYSKRTSLSPLFPDDTLGVYKKPVPYDCIMELSGKLQLPQIKFNIDLPTVDENTRGIVNSYLSTPTEMDKQVFSLLIVNSFASVQDRSSATTSVGQIAGVNSREFLSDELTNILNNVSNKFNVGVNWQPGTTPNSQELQVLISTMLFKDRVSINSDVGTNSGNGNTENTNNIIGEVTVEYKLSKDGKVKVKAFNKANDNTVVTLVNSPYTQGVGVSYSEGFNNFGDLWTKIKNKFKHNPKKEQNSDGTQ